MTTTEMEEKEKRTRGQIIEFMRKFLGKFLLLALLANSAPAAETLVRYKEVSKVSKNESDYTNTYVPTYEYDGLLRRERGYAHKGDLGGLRARRVSGGSHGGLLGGTRRKLRYFYAHFSSLYEFRIYIETDEN